MVFCLDNGSLDIGFQRGANAFKHQVEGRQLTDFMIPDLDRHLLEHTQHGAFAHRAVLALKGAMLRQILNGRLEQRELVRNKRIAVNEVLPILIVPVGLRAVGKVEQGLKIVGLRVINVRQQTNAFFGFHEQTLLDNLRHVGAGQLHAIGEPGLDFREVVALLFAHLADNRPHVLLGGHDDPCAASAFGCHALGDGLEVGHQLDVFSDVLTDLINKEVQTEIGRLPFDIRMHLFGKIFDGDTVLAAVFVEYPHGRCFVTTGYLGISFGNVFRLQQSLLAAFLPCSAR